MLGMSGWESVPAPQAGAGTGQGCGPGAEAGRWRTAVGRHAARRVCASPRRISAPPVAFLRHHAPGCFRHRRAPARVFPPKPAHRRAPSFVNLKPPACSACQGGKPCPRQKGRRGREPRTGRNGVQALVEWFERRRGHRERGVAQKGEGVTSGAGRNAAPSSSGSTTCFCARKPCLSAFCAERALPSGVFGPHDFAPLRRLASARALLMGTAHGAAPALDMAGFLWLENGGDVPGRVPQAVPV